MHVQDRVAIDGAELHNAGRLVASRNGIQALTLVIPTRNETDNVEPLVTRLEEALQGFDVEVLIVDDSDDETPQRVLDIAPRCTTDGFKLRLIHRQEAARNGGLSGAVIEGIREASHRWVVVMDGDLQHPPATINDLVAEAELTEAGLVLASRYVASGSSAGLKNRSRRIVSSACGGTARKLFGSTLANITDPMTGFFIVDTARLDLARLRPRGFKILLEILVSHPELKIGEVPFTFGFREHGESKATADHGWQYARQLLELKRGGTARLPWRYNIHGIIALESDQRLPELDKFVSRSRADIPCISVRIGDLSHLPLGESVNVDSDAYPVVSYRERTGFAMALELGPANTDIVTSSFVAKSPHVLYTNVVEPVLRWRMAEFGYALIHAACFADGNDAYLVTARTDTGKTTTMLKVLNGSELSFVSDDLIIVSSDGEVRTFPKPLTISAHTVHALRHTDLSRLERLALIPQSRLHSKGGRLFAFILTKYNLPVASINAIIQRLVPPPKYHVERLVRGVTTQRSAQARGMFIIQRGGLGEELIGDDEALSILLANCDDAFGFPPYSSLERLLLAAADEDLRLKEKTIIESAIASLPVLVMRSETLDWAERIPHAVREWNQVITAAANDQDTEVA